MKTRLLMIALALTLGATEASAKPVHKHKARAHSAKLSKFDLARLAPAKPGSDRFMIAPVSYSEPVEDGVRFKFKGNKVKMWVPLGSF